MRERCSVCGVRPRKKHRNSKYCKPCAEDLKHRPVGKLTASQERKARSLAGKIYFDQVAEKVGVPRSRLRRWGRDHQEINFNALKYPDDLVREVCEYYAEHGKIKTEKKYPNVKVRSIVERYANELGLDKRQVRWTDSQLIELAKMAGIVPFGKQAEYFDRPNANVGSIRSAWAKKHNSAAMNINGLAWNLAKEYVTNACPQLNTEFWKTKKMHVCSRRLVLWVDVEKYLKSCVPEHLRDAIKCLAKFQRWLHGRNVRASINKMIEEFDCAI